MSSYDVIIIGLGAMGSAAAQQCAQRGMKVLGLDANPASHELGSSHGATRAIRETYFESPEYVPLCQRSFELWQALEAESGQSLLSMKGALYAGPRAHPLLLGVMNAASRHDLPLDYLSATEMKGRFPGFALPETWGGLYEPRGGVLRSDLCLIAQRQLASQKGADLRFNSPALSWRRGPAGEFIVLTPQGEVSAGAGILTLGPWACEGLRDLNLPLTGRRIAVVHFDPLQAASYDPEDFSVYFWATPQGIFAGFPNFSDEGIKIMRHDLGDVCTADSVCREIDGQDVEQVAAFADRYMPGVNGGVRKSLVGLYTMTPDNHFILDSHPEFNNVVYATGFSGHGFKFAPVVGEILTDLVADGQTAQPVGFMAASRFDGLSAKSA